jgi:hypothetical protein
MSKMQAKEYFKQIKQDMIARRDQQRERKKADIQREEKLQGGAFPVENFNIY